MWNEYASVILTHLGEKNDVEEDMSINRNEDAYQALTLNCNHPIGNNIIPNGIKYIYLLYDTFAPTYDKS